MEIRRTTHATRQIKKLPAKARDEINNAIDSLASWPKAAQVKRLGGRDDYRLRVGRYRVLFTVTGTVIWVTQILLRDDNMY